MEASLAEDIKNLVITSCVEIRNKDLPDEIERISKESKDVSNESKTVDTVCNDAFEVTQELSKRIVELEKDLSKFEAKSIAFEIALQQKSKVETNQCDEIKVKDNFDEIETKNIELEYQVASLIKENEHLKLTYKNLFDSIKKSRVQTKTSNVTQNEAENLKSQLFEFAETKFSKILEKIEFFKKSPGEKQHLFENKTSVFQIKIDELEKVLNQQIKDFNAVKLELSNRTAKFEAYFEKLEKTKVVLERQLARKVDDSKAEKDQFLKEMNHLRTQLENLKGKSVETKFDKSSILGKPPADKLFVNSQISKSWFTPKVDVQKDLSKPVTAQSLPKNEKDQLLKQIAYCWTTQISNEYNTDDVVTENPQDKIYKWQKFMSFEPDIPETPVYKAKQNISNQYSQQSEVEKGKIFDNKESLIMAVRLKALSEGTVTRIKTDDNGVFEMLFIAIGASIRTFLNYLRPVLMIDAAHLKGLYKGTNLVAEAKALKQSDCATCNRSMQQGNRVHVSWRGCLTQRQLHFGDQPKLVIYKSDRPAAISLARKRIPFSLTSLMNILQIVQPDAYEKLCRAGPQRWSRAHCPLVRYNYMTSNSVESVNACSVIYRKEPVLKLAETYRAMVQEWYYKRRQLAANMTYEITDWAAHKVAKKRMKSATWVVKGVNEYQYQVSDGQYIRAVNLQTGICECRKWQLSGLPCGHVIAITRFLGLTDCVQYVADWFKKPKYQGTYSESIHFLGNMQQWEFPHNIQKAIPPRMDNPQPGRPKNTNRIQSQGEEPRVIQCSRCKQAGHKRDQCSQPFVVQPPVNIRTQNDQEIPRNNQPSFYNPTQHYDNTFHNINHYTSQQYGATTYPSQPYCETPYPSQPYDQHFTNTSQAYNGHHTESSQMYEQYNSQ
ncbi:transposase, MuDR, MULE transposase domain protein [Tanacetum coccineum]